jgi:hypothetical protein
MLALEHREREWSSHAELSAAGGGFGISWSPMVVRPEEPWWLSLTVGGTIGGDGDTSLGRIYAAAHLGLRSDYVGVMASTNLVYGDYEYSGQDQSVAESFCFHTYGLSLTGQLGSAQVFIAVNRFEPVGSLDREYIGSSAVAGISWPTSTPR